MNESHGETSPGQGGNGNLTPEQVANLERRDRYEARKKKGPYYPDTEEGLHNSFHADGNFENHFREEIKKRGIQISEEDLSKIILYSTVDASRDERYSFEGKQIHRVKTIDTSIESGDIPRSGVRPPLVAKAMEKSGERIFSDIEAEEFMKRFPLELGEAFRAAQETTTNEWIKRREESDRAAAKKTVDEL